MAEVTKSGNSVNVNSKGVKLLVWGFILFFVLVVGFVTLMKSVTDVDDGYRGVVVGLNGAKDESVDQGISFHAPWERIVPYPVNVVNVNYQDMSVSTKDGKNLLMDVDMNYKFKSDQVVHTYREYGNKTQQELEQSIIRTQVYDVVRETVANYTVIGVFGNDIQKLQDDAFNKARKKLDNIGVDMTEIVLHTPKADKATQDAIDARISATQQLEAEKTELEKAKAIAQRKIVEAEANAKANKIKSQSINDEIIKMELIEKWDGSQPITIGGESIVNLNK